MAQPLSLSGQTNIKISLFLHFTTYITKMNYINNLVSKNMGLVGKKIFYSLVLMYRSRDALSDDMTGEVCVRNSRSRLRNKLVVYSLVKL